jgi:hypothetical protein
MATFENRKWNLVHSTPTGPIEHGMGHIADRFDPDVQSVSGIVHDLFVRALDLQNVPIQMDAIVEDLDRVTGKSDDAFHEPLTWIIRASVRGTEVTERLSAEDEGHDLAAAGLAKRGKSELRKGDAGAEGEFLDEHVIANHERRKHGLGGYVEGLDHKRPKQERDRDR